MAVLNTHTPAAAAAAEMDGQGTDHAADVAAADTALRTLGIVLEVRKSDNQSWRVAADTADTAAAEEQKEEEVKYTLDVLVEAGSVHVEVYVPVPLAEVQGNKTKNYPV